MVEAVPPGSRKYGKNDSPEWKWEVAEVRRECEFLLFDMLACPFCDVSGHVGPHKMHGNETVYGSDARMTFGMNVVENLRLELSRNEGAKCFRGDIIKK
jgi:hypothetical protein